VTFVAHAWDAAGNEGVSAPATVHVNDTVPPTAVLTEPTAGFVRGTIGVAATADDPGGAVVRVRFLAGDIVIADDPIEPWRLDWDTTTIADGTYDVVAKAYDGAGHEGVTQAVSVTVDNTAPTVDIVEPLVGSDLGDTVQISVLPTDAAMDRVEVYLDGALLMTLRDGIWSGAWDTTWFDNGPHELTAQAFDKAGNRGDTIGSVAVAVHNGSTADYDLTLLAPRCTSVAAKCYSGEGLVGRGSKLGPERNAPNTINGSCQDGDLGAFHEDESIDELLVVAEDGLTPLAPGVPVRIDATVWAATADGTDVVDFYTAADAHSPAWVFVDSVPLAAVGRQTVSAHMTLPAGELQAVRANFRFATAGPAPCTPGDYNEADDLVFPTSQGPDTTPPTASIVAPYGGGVINGAILVRVSAFDAVGLAKVELYAGATLIGEWTAPPFEAIFDSSAFADGPVSLTAVAHDASGNSLTSAPVVVTVSNVPNASYDAALGAPRCSAIGSFCTAGDLVLGRAGTPLEPNGPNTIQLPVPELRCKDGTAGVFHVDESVDALRVYTPDGLPLAAGIPAVVEATVWAYTAYDADRLDLYGAANSSSPQWTYLGTLAPSGPGAQVLAKEIVLPSGGAQAVRAHYRYGGTPAACGAGSYDDHDDLAFVVDPNVAYDSSLKAPSCPRVASFCDSGALLNGRAALGPEANAPNTLKGSSCQDGKSGQYHREPSIDGIRVATIDQSPMATGKQVRVSVSVWASTLSWGSERVDVYSAPDATSPAWTYVGTLQPAGSGAQVVWLNFVLPSGSLQAVRAHYRTGGTPSSCGTGSFDDHDDLVFAVRP
jgi:hypothetical protein